MNNFLKDARKKANYTQAQVSEMLGIPLGTLRRWEQNVNEPDMGSIIALARAYRTSTDYLLTGGNSLCASKPNPNSKPVPYYGHIAAGTPIGFDTADCTIDCPCDVADKFPNGFFLKVEGDSMSRRIPNGAIALIDPEQREPTNEKSCYAVCVNGDRATIKRIRRLDNGIELIPDSYDPTYRSKIFDYNDDSTKTVTVFGKVVWFMMPFDFEV